MNVQINQFNERKQIRLRSDETKHRTREQKKAK